MSSRLFSRFDYTENALKINVEGTRNSAGYEYRASIALRRRLSLNGRPFPSAISALLPFPPRDYAMVSADYFLYTSPLGPTKSTSILLDFSSIRKTTLQDPTRKRQLSRPFKGLMSPESPEYRASIALRRRLRSGFDIFISRLTASGAIMTFQRGSSTITLSEPR